MANLYPLKFKPQYINKIWGGSRFKTVLGREDAPLEKCGESWELSGVDGNISVVSNGELQGNSLQEIIEIYMDELVGEKVFDKFGLEFPLLFKFIDANDDLSLQVHPNDELAKERHNSYGKTELWYVMDSTDDATLMSGFNQSVSRDMFIEYFVSKRLIELMKIERVKRGDSFLIPAGRVHSICRGTFVVEIQQTSDVTYRIFDYDRLDLEGNKRELHVELALDAIDYSYSDDYRIHHDAKRNTDNLLAKCNYFTANYINFDQQIEKDYYELDSFVVYMCLSGSFEIEYDGGKECVGKGETVLIPASLKEITLTPTSSSVEILEVYIKE